ncbi:DNA sulfur modification protein DndD [Microcoleus sp. FACHB-831]|uniref:DNA sulfur modification protein DndD n=1 Tax=Microcoleus sp. FACHB-831 TaxID=2692827 RepID=UPI001682B553|nr:DNA sulfur modification protein DndD [Microcoleus sp. FACHB-831]MBD1919658.1 DNA sulfur modification protein DndD [Microcoleus sp. FACHB-831]
MIFRELVLQNFGPYRGHQVINLTPQIDDNPRPIILFGGMNGGGKTTLIDAIRLALYGHRAQCSTRGNLGYGEFLIQSINKHTPPTEDTRIELAFENILNDVAVEFRIVRYWNKYPKDGKDLLGVMVDNWPNDVLTKTWDEHIENMLPLGISNLFLFDGEQVKELAEQDVPPAVVVNAIESLLGLELAERLSYDLDILVNRKRKAIADAKELLSIEALEQKQKQLQEESNLAREQLENSGSKLKFAHEQHHQAQEKFLSEGGKIAAERSQLEKKLWQLNADTAAQRQSISEIGASALPLTLIEPLLSETLTQGQNEARCQQAKIARDLLVDRDKRLLNCIAHLDIHSEQIAKIESFLEEENQQLEQEASSHESWLLADVESLNQLSIILNQQLSSQKRAAQEKLANLKNLEEDIISTERQLAAAPSPEVYEKLEESLNQSRLDLAYAQTAYDTAKRKCDGLANAIANAKKELEQFSDRNIARQNDEHIIAATAKVQATIKLFRERLTLRKLNQLESVVTEFFLYLLHKSDLVHRVIIDAKTFSLSLYDNEGKPVPKHRLSAGEKQLLAIAFLWGLARVSGRKLPIAIDTPLGRLDSSHRANLVERYFPSASHQVILLSTDTEIGKKEVDKLRDNEAIAREYLLKYDTSDRQTTVQPGYFW